jgi:methyl-accepting chemotaxis protein
MADASVPTAETPEYLAAREARRSRMRRLSERIHLVLVLGPGPGAVALYGLHYALAPVWQFGLLLALSVLLWASFAVAYLAARRGRTDVAADVVFFGVWLFCALALGLRTDTLATTLLAYVGILVLAWLLAPRRVLLGGALVLVSAVGLRILDHLGLLPAAVPPPGASVAFDVGLILCIVPVLAFGLHLGTQVNRLPFEHLRRSTEAQNRVLETVARVQPDLRTLAESASRGAGDLAASAEQQAATARSVASAATELQQLLARSAEAAAAARDLAEGTRRGSAETAERLEAVERQLQSFLHDLSAIVESVEGLSRQALGTEEVIESVEDVHAVVKILALNAGLEAARAGATGTGIGAVAAEMRTLISGTEAGVGEGRRLLAGVRTGAAAAISRAREGAHRLEEHLRDLARARDEVRRIVDAFAEASRGVETIAASGEEQRRQVEVVARAARDLDETTAGLTGLASNLAEGVGQFAASQREIARLVEGRAEAGEPGP